MVLVSLCTPPQFEGPNGTIDTRWGYIKDAKCVTTKYEDLIKAHNLALTPDEFKTFVDLAELANLVHRIEVLDPSLTPKAISELPDDNLAQRLEALCYSPPSPTQGFHTRFLRLAVVLKSRADEFDKLLSQSGTQDTRTFINFPKLPPELRQKIWFYALPGPRVLELYRVDLWSLSPVTLSKAAHLPLLNIFSVCRESRAVVLMHFTPVLLRRMGLREMSRGQTILVDHNQDILYFHFEKWHRWHSQLDLSLLQNGAAQFIKFKKVAFPASVCESFLKEWKLIQTTWLKDHPNLQTLMLTQRGDDFRLRGTLLEFITPAEKNEADAIPCKHATSMQNLWKSQDAAHQKGKRKGVKSSPPDFMSVTTEWPSQKPLLSDWLKDSFYEMLFPDVTKEEAEKNARSLDPLADACRRAGAAYSPCYYL